MTPPSTLSVAVARLVRHLSEAPDAPPPAPEALAAACGVPGTLTLASLAGEIAARPGPGSAGAPPEPLDLLVARLAAHSVAALEVRAGVEPAALLALARLLAGPAVPDDDGRHIAQRVAALGSRHLAVRVAQSADVRRLTPIDLPRIGYTPPQGMLTVTVPGFEMPMDTARTRGAPTPATGIPTVPTGATVGANDPSWAARASTSQQALPPLGDVVARLRGGVTGDDALRVLGYLAVHLERLAADAAWQDAVEALTVVLQAEAVATDPETRRVYALQLRRICSTSLLHGLARFMATRRDQREAVEAILQRAGDPGAEALIELLVTSGHAAERRVYRSAIARCPAAGKPLVHLLYDRRWYVVRNAAELVGELGEASAETALTAVLGHADARVRRAAITSLARLGTTDGLAAIPPLLRDPNAAVRLQAAHALGTAVVEGCVPPLLALLAEETDPEVQRALCLALGAQGTPEAIQRLVQLAQPGGLLSRRPSAPRVSAVLGLGKAARPAAKAALQALADDRDADVKAAVARALGTGRGG